ncbi:MAG: hypothetical protein U1E70_06310 [Acetobacteraceae bacterium]|nr:hypothetical protein [Pseudomonadota bacterium]
MDADEILSRYRRYRELSIKHHSQALARVSVDTMLERARHIGMAKGRTLIVGNESEYPMAYDLALYTAPAGRSRAVDRHVQTALPNAEGEEAEVVDGMRKARFALVSVIGRHEVAGVMLRDLGRHEDIWLVDEALAEVAKPGLYLALRMMPVGGFWITCGVLVPVGPSLLAEAMTTSARSKWEAPSAQALDEPRLAIAIYRAAISQEAMAGISYRDVNEAVAR